MGKFVKENAVFVINSIILIGLISGVMILQKMQITDQENAYQTPASGIADTAQTEGVQSLASITVENTASPEIIPTPISTPKPKPAPVKSTSAPRRFSEEGSDD